MSTPKFKDIGGHWRINLDNVAYMRVMNKREYHITNPDKWTVEIIFTNKCSITSGDFDEKKYAIRKMYDMLDESYYTSSDEE